MSVAEIRRRHDLEVVWTPFPLHPEVPEEGVALTDLFGPRVDIAGMMARLHQVADGLGLPLGDRTRTFNSRRAQELGLWAEASGKGEAFRDAVYRAYFADGKNLARDDVLLGLCRTVGLEPHEAKQALARGTHAPAVDRAWARARKLGIRAVPAHSMAGRVAEGFHPADRLEAWVTQGGRP